MSPAPIPDSGAAGGPGRALRRLAVLLLILLAAAIAWAPSAPAQSPAAEPPATQSGAAESAAAQPGVVNSIRVVGNRRIPKETILARMYVHPGEAYDQTAVERSFNSLWNTEYFEDLRIDREDSPDGVILNVYVRERPTIREINYKGLNSVTQSDVLDRFKKEKVGLSVESQYDPTRIKRAETVLREMLAEHGHQFATIRTEVKTIPPAAVQVNFNIKEGPTVKVGKIQFVGNRKLSATTLRRAMKNLRPIGIPHSLIFENIFARTFDASKLEEDAERVQAAYRERGYMKATYEEPVTHVRNEGGVSLFTFRPRKGKRMDIQLTVEEGERYRLAGIRFTGNKAVQNVKALRGTFPNRDGEFFNLTQFQKGLENLRKAYSQLGYINVGSIPTPSFDEASKTVTWTIDIDEGKPFYVSRIEFSGNTVTRDRVIRRELLLEEGQVYNSQLWELSLMRLNQLDYFEPLKVDQDSEIHQDAQNNTVDLLLKVKEKGKNSIGLNGGVSGLSGAFMGINYQTNNFLGLGETLSLQANLGNLQRQFLFGFTEPYIRNRPLNMGFQIFDTKYDYNSAKNYQTATGSSLNLTAASQNLIQNYNQSSEGVNFSISYPLRRRTPQRVGLTYSFTRSSVTTFSAASASLFETLNFRSGIQGSNALQGILTSLASFSYSYNTISNPVKPRSGRELSAALQISGIGGNVRYVSPVIEGKYFHPMKGLRFNEDGHNVLGIRVQAAYIAGYGGDSAPPTNRFFSGGEADLRGFDIRAATPYAFIPQRILFNLTNPDSIGNPGSSNPGSSCVPRDPTNPQLNQCIQVPLPIYGIVSVGGDTQVTTNLEYRIPIAGPVTFAFFDDFGIDVAARDSQLKQSPLGSAALNSALYGCPLYVNGACQGGHQVHFNNYIRPIDGTNLVPRMSLGAELQVVLPIVNAPFRLYYAYNPLRLDTRFAGQNLITRDMFPAGGAGDYSYQQAQQLYGSYYNLLEPRKTFRLTVSTTF